MDRPQGLLSLLVRRATSLSRVVPGGLRAEGPSDPCFSQVYVQIPSDTVFMTRMNMCTCGRQRIGKVRVAVIPGQGPTRGDCDFKHLNKS